jgi:hypothetical protein
MFLVVFVFFVMQVALCCVCVLWDLVVFVSAGLNCVVVYSNGCLLSSL